MRDEVRELMGQFQIEIIRVQRARGCAVGGFEMVNGRTAANIGGKGLCDVPVDVGAEADALVVALNGEVVSVRLALNSSPASVLSPNFRAPLR